MHVAAALVLALSTTAAAQPASTPPSTEAASPASASAPASPEAASPEAASPEAASPPKRKPNQRVLCGCASSRFLVPTGVKGPAVIDAGHPVAAWLHGGARLDTFVRAESDGDGPPRLVPATLPTSTTTALSTSTSQLVQVKTTGDGSGFLGITRPGEKAPRDVLAIALALSSSMAPTPPAAPQLAALWLGAAEERERKDCGTFVTQRVHWQLKEGSPDVAALVVKDVDSGEAVVVDARHAGAFGLGYVDVCEHGAAVKSGAQRWEITPVSPALAQGGTWGFAHDGSGATDPTRTAVPAGADTDLTETGFPKPQGPEKPMSMLSVGGVWTGTVGAIGLFGAVGFVFWRLKRRRLENVVCSACGANVPVDVLDEKVDGFFCPTCGAAGMWRHSGKDGVTITSSKLPS